MCHLKGNKKEAQFSFYTFSQMFCCIMVKLNRYFTRNILLRKSLFLEEMENGFRGVSQEHAVGVLSILFPFLFVSLYLFPVFLFFFFFRPFYFYIFSRILFLFCLIFFSHFPLVFFYFFRPYNVKHCPTRQLYSSI